MMTQRELGASRPTMTQREFSNGLRILINIDLSEFPGPHTDWEDFRDNPWRYFITCPDYVCDRLWAIIQQRQAKKPDRSSPMSYEDEPYDPNKRLR